MYDYSSSKRYSAHSKFAYKVVNSCVTPAQIKYQNSQNLLKEDYFGAIINIKTLDR